MLHLTGEEVRSAYRQIFERRHALLDVWPVRMTLLRRHKGDMLVIKPVSSHKCPGQMLRYTPPCASPAL